MPQPASEARAPAPGRLELVQSFLNSLDRQTGPDALATPDDIRGWLVGQRLVSPHVEFDEADRRHLVELREALHELVAANSGLGTNRRAVTTLNEAARRIRLGMRLHPDDG